MKVTVTVRDQSHLLVRSHSLWFRYEPGQRAEAEAAIRNMIRSLGDDPTTATFHYWDDDPYAQVFWNPLRKEPLMETAPSDSPQPTGWLEIFKDKRGQWRWRVKARNGEIVAASEGYATKGNAVRGAADLANALGVERSIERKILEG